MPAGFRWSIHYIVNAVLEVHGDTAAGSWDFLVYSQRDVPPGSPAINFFGTYEDQYRKENGVWKIANLRIELTAPEGTLR